ncbi:MAG TPA: hypothetical protein VN041_09255 [Microbacterium sp.]|nr:hypothetical protein [Microbacterium sp.]
MAEFEARITVYKDGQELMFNDALGDSASDALYAAHHDLWNDIVRMESSTNREDGSNHG